MMMIVHLDTNTKSPPKNQLRRQLLKRTSQQWTGQHCRLSDLKLTKSFFHQVNVIDNTFFLSHGRVHVDEVEVYLKEATYNGCEDTDINLLIFVTGMMKDIFRGKDYKFHSYSRVLEQSYQMKEDDNYKVTTVGKVSDEWSVIYYVQCECSDRVQQ